jgi:hypothetical protein
VLPPSPELVAHAWLASLPQLAGQGVGGDLPPVSTWSGEVFIQTTAVSGGADPYTPLRSPVVQLDVWAATVHSDRPAWYRAAAYCEYIRDATYGSLGHGLLDMPFPGYAPARLGSVEAHGDPRKAMGDVTGMAHYQLDLQFTYVQSDLVIT